VQGHCHVATASSTGSSWTGTEQCAEALSCSNSQFYLLLLDKQPVLLAPLGQAQSNVQQHCHVATASSTCARAQDAYSKLNCAEGQGTSCSGACLHSLLLGLIPCEHLQTSRKTVRALPCLLTCLTVTSFLAISRWLTVASIADLQKTPCLVSCYDPVAKRPVFVSTIDQVTASAQAIVTLVLCQYGRSTLLGNTRHVQVITHNSVANPCL
jgi:hypothetical protein